MEKKYSFDDILKVVVISVTVSLLVIGYLVN